MKQAILCFPIRQSPAHEVMLGYKKIGFGQGKLTGVGGKIEPGERPLTAAIRELFEETSLIAAESDLQPVGQITFRFPHKPTWDIAAHLFLLRQWQGQPRESNELRPQWVAIDALPYDLMWDDGRYWLPLILHGQPITAEFTYAADNQTIATYQLVKQTSSKVEIFNAKS